MAIDTTAPRTRRAVLAATLGGLAASIASALGRPEIARAGSDGDVVLGVNNSAGAATSISVNLAGSPAFWGTNNGSGDGVTGVSSGGAGIHGQSTTLFGVYGLSNNSGAGVKGESGTGGKGVHGVAPSGSGVYGESTSGAGVVGTSPSIGVSGTSTSGTGVLGSSGTNSGVAGYSNATGAAAAKFWSPGNSTGVLGFSGDTPPTPPGNTGVYGEANQDGSARGVFGRTTVGQAVRGQASTGIAGYFASAGTALQTSGKVKVNRSGKASIPANASSVDVTVPGGLAGTPLPFATLQMFIAGVFVVAVRPNYPASGVMRIYLNKVASTTASTAVSWLVLG